MGLCVLTPELASDKLALESWVQIQCLECTVLRRHFEGASVCGRVRVSVGVVMDVTMGTPNF